MKKQFLVLLSVSALATAQAQNFNQASAGGSLLNTYGNATGGGAIINTTNVRANTQGTRFMFNNWLKGTVVDANGTVVNDDSLQFNFDKQTNNLLATRDQKSIISVPPAGVKDFTLTQNGKSYRFERNKAVDSTKILLALVEGSGKYSLYKYVKTEFIKSDYHTNGIVQSGNEYDEYLDHTVYYVTKQGVPGYRVVDTKLKSLKQAFSDDNSKLFDYMGQHIDETIDENYLTALVNYINQ